MSGRVAHQPAWVKLVATAAILAIAWTLGLPIGEQPAGVVGVLLAIPVVVVVKEAVAFLGERLGEGAVPVTAAPGDDAGAARAPGGPPPVTVTRELPGRIEPPALRHPT